MPQTFPDGTPQYGSYRGSAGSTGGTALPSSTQTAQNRVRAASDIWGLGQLYGMPIFLGEVPTVSPAFGPNGEYLGKTAGTTNSFGSTQDLMKQAADMWTAQSVQKQQNPNQP